MGQGARGKGHGAWSMGHGAWSMGHGAWSMGHGASGDEAMAQKKLQFTHYLISELKLYKYWLPEINFL